MQILGGERAWKPFVPVSFTHGVRLFFGMFSVRALTAEIFKVSVAVIVRAFKAMFDNGARDERLLMADPCEGRFSDESLLFPGAAD